MLPIHEIELFLQNKPPHLQEIALELRNVIMGVAPDAVEVIRWGGLSYFHEGRGGIVSAGICQIGIHDDHVRLEVIHGVYIADPHHHFEGKQKIKRFVRIETYDGAPWEDLKELITSSARFNPRSLKSQYILSINKKS